MTDLNHSFSSLETAGILEKEDLVRRVIDELRMNEYHVVEVNDQKPWGAYIRINNDNAQQFIAEFFPGLSISDARLGVENAELSPKILIVSPGQRLSWQFHNRRAERWTFLTSGAYMRSDSDREGELITTEKGDVIQFLKGERHRLIGAETGHVIVAEIWQHTELDHPSDEDDIIRVSDDYKR